MDIQEQFDKIYELLGRHEDRLKKINFQKQFKKYFKKKLNFARQSNAYKSIHLALCVDTDDPLKQNRVRYFSPVLHIPLKYSTRGLPGGAQGPSEVTTIEQLDWAWPCSAMGGFDDCGLSWVPPVGSMLCLLFLHGDSGMAFYTGTTWYRDKGPIQHDNWNYHIPEYYKTWEGHRSGYMVGPNDESQVFPSNNTSNYQGYDIDSNEDSDLEPDASTKTTTPHEYTITTPDKHRVILDDGDPSCNRRDKRIEIISSMGGSFLIKDDPYHRCGNWLNPNCFISYTDVIPSVCAVSMTIYTDPINNIISFTPVLVPFPCDQGPENCNRIPDTPSLTLDQEYYGSGTATIDERGVVSITNREDWCPSKTPFPDTILPNIPQDCLNGIITGLTDFCFTFNNMGTNKYQKHRHQCFPYLLQDCGLPQSGIQIRARSGSKIVFDDSVEEPRERPEWERTLKPFDMDGCTGNFRGRTYWQEATGAYIEMVGYEDQPKLRGARNGINIVDATGNQISLNSQTLPGCVAGPLRGMHFKSSANHTLDFCDDGNRQCSGDRSGCAKTGPYAKNAFVKLRSGYGIGVTLFDGDQTKTDQQYFQIMSPQKDNLTRGPHVLHMQETANGPGQVFLRAGGDYIVYSYDKFVEVVGVEKDNPADKMEFISRHKLVSVKDVYYNRCGTGVFWADDYIFLLAGKGCDGVDGSEQPCVYPVVVAFQQIPEYVSAVTGLKASEHVFASAIKEPDDPCEGIASDP
jgi:Type VI secretion system/phage-baseplate injector OB domain